MRKQKERNNKEYPSNMCNILWKKKTAEKVNDIEKETSSVRHALSLILDLIVKYESYIRQNEDENFKIGKKE